MKLAQTFGDIPDHKIHISPCLNDSCSDPGGHIDNFMPRVKLDTHLDADSQFLCLWTSASVKSLTIP